MGANNNNSETSSVYRRLVRDPRICHGAFRLWHCLRDYADAGGVCFPSQKTVAKDIGCKVHSLEAWTKQLVAANYLEIVKRGAHGNYVYRVLGGDGAELPKPAYLPKASTAEKGGSDEARYAPLGSQICPSGSASTAPKGILSKPNEVNPVSNLIIPLPLNTPEFKAAWFEWIAYRRQLGARRNHPRIFGKQLQWLANFPPTTAIEIINASIRNGWQGLFEPKVKTHDQRTNSSRNHPAGFFTRKSQPI